MKAIHGCAATKGLDLPPPPPMNGEAPKGPPPVGADGKPAGKPPEGQPPHGHHKKLTDAERAILDACFEANGVTPPPKPPEGGPAHKTPTPTK